MAGAELSLNSYGKAKIRVLRVQRAGQWHDIKQVEVAVLLEGAFAPTYLEGDNRSVVATDSMKNIVNILARQHASTSSEQFATAIGQFILERYDHVDRATVTLQDQPWHRMEVDGQPHPHAFQGGNAGEGYAEAVCRRDGSTLTSGIRGHALLKTTASGFRGYVNDEFTTLRETTDRILATRLDATWQWTATPSDYGTANRAVVQAMHRVFATEYSESAQQTLYRMGLAALDAVPEIGMASLVLPNIHYIPVDLTPFGLDNPDVVLVPTDAPHGEIRGTVRRS